MLLLFSPIVAVPADPIPPIVTTPTPPEGGNRVVCERCGFRAKARKLRKEWTGFMVCKQCFDPRPADTRPPKLRPEGLPRKNARIEPAPIFRAEGELGGDDL